MSEVTGLAERLSAIDARIADALRESGRESHEVTRIVVTKFHPASLVRELAALGVREVGENRHQEARDKAEATADLGLDWHFIGQLQSNKARQVRRYASAVHSVDRPVLVTALAADDGALLDVFLQLNLTDDPARGGAREGDLPALAEAVLAAPGLRLRGIMAVAPLGEDAARAFARVRSASEVLRRTAPDAVAISAGMSHDFPEAIRAGATHLRIGTAITGKRPERG